MLSSNENSSSTEVFQCSHIKLITFQYKAHLNIIVKASK